MQTNLSTAEALGTFVRALLLGLVWGVAGATVLGGAAIAFAVAGGWTASRDIFHYGVEGAAWTAVGASVLAVFPIGPIAAVVGWSIYRRGVTSLLAYAAAGAVCAVFALALVVGVAVMTMRYAMAFADVEAGAGVLIAAGTAAAGAFGGFMAGRVIRRGLLQRTRL